MLPGLDEAHSAMNAIEVNARGTNSTDLLKAPTQTEIEQCKWTTKELKHVGPNRSNFSLRILILLIKIS